MVGKRDMINKAERDQVVPGTGICDKGSEAGRAKNVA